MEGKDHLNEDEELNPNSDKEGSSDADSDNFGLPDYSEPEDISPEEKKEEDEFTVEEPYASESWEEEKHEEGEPESYDYGTDESQESSTEEENEAFAGYDNDFGSSEDSFDSEQEETDEYSRDEIIQNAHDEEIYEQKKSPVLWIILMIIVVIGLGVGLFWWINREEPAKVVTKKKQPPKVEQPAVTTPEPEPLTTEPAPAAEETFDRNLSGNLTVGQIIDVTSPTGLYYVIVASAIDDDLLRDYANKLINNGYGCAVLAPTGKTKFYRLAVAEFTSLNDAAVKSEELKGEFGDKVWVKKY